MSDHLKMCPSCSRKLVRYLDLPMRKSRHLWRCHDGDCGFVIRSPDLNAFTKLTAQRGGLEEFVQSIRDIGWLDTGDNDRDYLVDLDKVDELIRANWPTPDRLDAFVEWWNEIYPELEIDSRDLELFSSHMKNEGQR